MIRQFLAPRIAVCLLASFAILGRAAIATSQGASFTPFENWKAAVVTGDKAALAKLYSTNPPATAFEGKTKIDNLDDELQFWAGLKSAGVTDFNPKVLSVTTLPDQKRLILRIDAVKTNGGANGGALNIVASMMQVWVPQANGWRLAGSQRSNFQADAGRRLPEPAKPNPALYPDPNEAAPELKAATALAAKENKRVLVVFGANWCYDCHVLDTTFRSKEFAHLVTANYVVLHVNIGDEGKDNNDLAGRLGVGLDRGIPSLAVLDPNGQTVVAQRNGEFESTVRIGPDDVRAFLEKWKPAKK
jgi:thioredoxin 1